MMQRKAVSRCGRKAGAILLAMTLLMLLLPMGVWAKTEDFKVTLNEKKENYVFSIQWENTEKKPDVVITSPSGKTYTLENKPEADAGDGELMFFFATAEKGEWTVSVTGEGLGALTMDAGVMPGRMDITSFSVSVKGDKGTASWKIADSEDELTLEIWATTDPVDFGGERLSSQRGKASDKGEFSLSGLDSGDYYLYLKAIGTGGVFACQYSDDRISWRRDDALPKLSNAKARMLDDDVWITWDEMEEADSYRVMVFDPSTGEMLEDETVTGVTSWTGTFSQDISSFEAAVAACRNGVTGDFERMAVSRGSFDGVEVTFPEGENLNTTTITVQVAFSGDYTVSAALNDDILCEDSATAGDYRVDMEEGDNRVSFYVTDGAGNVRTYGKDFHVDITPPQLSILHDINGQSTSDDHIYLEGHTENGAVLTLNGEEVETTAGYFTVRCALSAGQNQLELVATDAAGNQSRYTAQVERPWFSAQILLWVICIVVGVVLLAVYLILFIRGRRKKA